MNNLEEMSNLVEKYQAESFNYPHGIICSEKTAKLLKDKSESISGNKVKSIVSFNGMLICAEKYFIEDKLWLLNKELWEIYLKEGFAGLLKSLALKWRSKV